MSVNEPRRWKLGENPVLDTKKVSSMDWMGVFWMLFRRSESGTTAMQFLLGPNTLVTRKVYPGISRSSEIDRFTHMENFSTMTDFASSMTKDLLLSSGWGVLVKPYVSDFVTYDAHTYIMSLGAEHFHNHHIVTLGDAIAHGDDPVLGYILKYAETP